MVRTEGLPNEVWTQIISDVAKQERGPCRQRYNTLPKAAFVNSQLHQCAHQELWPGGKFDRTLRIGLYILSSSVVSTAGLRIPLSLNCKKPSFTFLVAFFVFQAAPSSYGPLENVG